MTVPSPVEQAIREFAARPMQPTAAAAASGRSTGAVGAMIGGEVELIAYPAPSTAASHESSPTPELVGTLGNVELEYAALRRGAGLLDAPHRATLEVTGADRRAFLDRMVTNALSQLGPGSTASAFWLNRKGRIESDLFIIELGERMLMDVDVHQAASTVQSLGGYVFSEDVALRDVSGEVHQLWLMGRRAAEVLAAASNDEQCLRCAPNAALTLRIGEADVVAARADLVGELGFILFAPADKAASVWRALVHAPGAVTARPIGWYAFNTARIEAGTPLFNIDFGSTNLPHETGLVDHRVSFTKGCYLGQEVVSRMHNLGQPMQKLVGLRIEGTLLPVAGAQVFAAAKEPDDASSAPVTMTDPIGVVTSSTISPMRSSAPVAFAMIRTAHAKEGTHVRVNAEGEQASAIVAPLRSWPADER